MKPGEIKRGLQQFRKIFQKILEDDASLVIDEAVSEIDSSRHAYDALEGRNDNPRLVVRPWGYHIYPERPLKFKISNAIKGFAIQADIFCTILWKDENSLPVEQSIHLRLWSNEIKYIVRAEWDSSDVIDKLSNNRRVMYRCHFDLANQNQTGPKFHCQFGGNARSDEAFWFPEALNIPRIQFPPMDLILLGQLVAANFFPDEYKRFCKTPEWITIMRESQKSFWEDYYKSCSKEISSKNSLLEALWNN